MSYTPWVHANLYPFGVVQCDNACIITDCLICAWSRLTSCFGTISIGQRWPPQGNQHQDWMILHEMAVGKEAVVSLLPHGDMWVQTSSLALHGLQCDTHPQFPLLLTFAI